MLVKANSLDFTAVVTKFEKFNRVLSGWFEWIGVVGLLVIMLITVIDIVGAKLFLWRIFGAIDVVMLFQTMAIAFALSITLIVDRHIRTEFFVTKLPKHTQAIIDSIIHLFGLVLFILVVWQLCVHGYSFQRSGEVSATARIPLYPFAYGIALASIPVCLVLLQQLLSLVVRLLKR